MNTYTERLFDDQRPMMACPDIDSLGFLSAIVVDDGAANDNRQAARQYQNHPLTDLVKNTMEGCNEPA